MKGRKAIPEHLKVVKGTSRNTRKKNTPDPAENKPWPPSWLTPRAKKIFHLVVKRLKDLKLDSQTYTEGIALLASRLEEVERFDKMLQEGFEIEVQDGDKKVKKHVQGYVYQTTNSYGDMILKEHPAVKLRDKAMRHTHSLLAEFGLTGASINKIGVKGKKQTKNEFDEF